MKLGRIIDSRFHAALNKFAGEPLPLRVAFKLKGISKLAQNEFAKYEEVRHAALAKYATKNEDGSIKVDETSNAVFDNNGLQEFMRELAELSNIEVEVRPIKLSELGDNVKLTLAELDVLDGVIVED